MASAVEKYLLKTSGNGVSETGRYKTQVTGHRSGHRAQGTGHRSQGTGHRAQVTGHRAQGTGHRAQKTQ